MSRSVLLLGSAALAVGLAFPAFAIELATNHLSIPIAPNAGNASIDQWGGIDDKFAVNPDGDEAPRPAANKRSPLASSQDGVDDNDPGDPDPDHNLEVLPI